MRNSRIQSDNRRSAAGAAFNLLLTVVPVWIFFSAYMRFYKDATFWGRGNYLFTLIYTVLPLLYEVYSVAAVMLFILLFMHGILHAVTLIEEARVPRIENEFRIMIAKFSSR